MKSVIRAGPQLESQVCRRLRMRAIFDYCKWDPHCEDHAVLADFPLLLTRSELARLRDLAERLAAEALAAEREILANPELLRKLAIPKKIRQILREIRNDTRENADGRVMRFDFHYTMDGWRISEVNADVPGGYVEASGWNRLFAAENEGTSAPPDASEAYADEVRVLGGERGIVALVHATVYSEDRQIMVHLARAMKTRGMKPILVGPQHIEWKNGQAKFIAGFGCSDPIVIVRLYPAEWLPAIGGDNWRGWFTRADTPMSNPGRAVILQSKRFPLVWEHLRCDLATWRQLLPEATYPQGVLEPEFDEWVFKPAFGRVGEDVAIRSINPEAEFESIVRSMRKTPEKWVAQRKFQIVPVETEGGPVYPCIGVYTVGGRVAGLYGRVSASPLIDCNALDAAVLLTEGESE